METLLSFAPVQSANDSARPVTEGWYEDLQGGWGDSIGATA